MITKKFIFTLMVIFLGCQSGYGISPADKKMIVAYIFVENNLIDPQTVAVEKLTHINYAFADIKEGKIFQGFAHDQENFKILNELKKRNPELKVLISIGGWTWSGGFSKMALTERSRRIFIDSAIDFMLFHRLDGIDIDWEFPGLIGYGNDHRPEDKVNFTALMRELSLELDRQGRKQNRRFISSFAGAAFPDFITNTELGKVQKYVDMVNIMTYDMYEAGYDSTTGHHAPLYTHPLDKKGISVDWAVKAYIKEGVPGEKIVLGVPFYGRSWQKVKGEKNGLYQPGQEAQLESSYNNIVSKYENKNGFVRCWDDVSKAPYLWNSQKQMFISYDDPQSLILKCQYLKDKNLGGVMFWEYSCDFQNILLNTLYNSLNH